MKRKVFIVSNGGHDYSDAERFGEIIFLTDHVIPKNDVAQMFRELNDGLEMAEAQDLLLISSLTSLCSIASAILANRFGEVHFLIHHNGKYEQRDLILE